MWLVLFWSTVQRYQFSVLCFAVWCFFVWSVVFDVICLGDVKGALLDLGIWECKGVKLLLFKVLLCGVMCVMCCILCVW